jgi:Domain of unknown function (DUF5666)
MNRKMLNALILGAGLALLATPSFSQGPQGGPGSPGGYGERRPGRRGMAFGTVQSVGVNQFVAQKPDGSTVTVKVDSQTQLMDQDKPIQLEDLKVGDHVVVRPRASDNGATGGGRYETGASTVTAAMVRRVPPGMAAMFEGDRAFGRITAINGNQITIQGRQGEKTIVVSNDTQYMKDGQTASLNELKVGDPVMVAGKEANGQFTASRVMTRSFGTRRQSRPPNGP